MNLSSEWLMTRTSDRRTVTFIIATEAGESFAKLVFNIIVSLTIPEELLSG